MTCRSPPNVSQIAMACICLIIAVSVACIVGAQAACDAGDSSALLDFKNDFIDSVGIFSSWVRRTDCCFWTGVHCPISSGRVTGLTPTGGLNWDMDYPNPKRNSTLPVGSSIGRLTQLVYFYTNVVSFGGPIPPSWANLKDLTVLDLSSAGFTGSIPAFFGSLTNLTHLRFDGPGNLSGSLPTELCSLPKLQTLGLSRQNLSGSLPQCLGTLKNLTQLFLDHNDLSGDFPPWLGDLPGLVTVNLDYNRFTGAISTSIGLASSLTMLFISANLLDGPVPSEIGNLSELSVFIAANNSLSGPIPSSIGKLSNLVYLDLSWNKLSGSIPSSIGQLTNLEYLCLQHNILTGPLPPEIGSIVPPVRSNDTTIVIQIDYNFLDGSIPDTISNLNIFSASHNNFTGDFPLSLTSVIVVDVSYNFLYELQPNATLPNGARLQSLSLQHNEFWGSIPSWLPSITSLYRVDISENMLNGPLPVELLTLPTLTSLNVSNNFLNTVLPSGPFKSGISTLDLHSDALYGKVPEGFVSFFPQVVFLDLSSNPELKGPVPHVP